MFHRSGRSGFRDRVEAGRQLAERLRRERLEGDVVVLGLPRGGVPVAAEVAAVLGAPLDVLVVRKLGAPFNPELAIGAIALGGITVYNDDLLDRLACDEAALEAVRDRERAELARREAAYRGRRPAPELGGRTVVLVDDGIATGATMHAAASAVRATGPREIVVAVPSCSVEAAQRLRSVADRVIALIMPDPYLSVGTWYQFFEQTSDATVIELLNRYAEKSASAHGAADES